MSATRSHGRDPATEPVRPGPSPEERHLRPDSPARYRPDNFRLIRCDQCGRLAYERHGQTCRSCRAAPKDNWWAVVYGGYRPENAPRPHESTCAHCGRTRWAPRNVPDVVQRCAHCLPEDAKLETSKAQAVGAGETMAPPKHLTALRQFVRQHCGNAKPGDGCILNGHGCAAIRGGQCEHFEKVLAADLGEVPEKVRQGYAGGRLQVAFVFWKGNRCNLCSKPISGRKQFCGGCRQTRRRNQFRAEKQRQRVNRRRPPDAA